MKCINTLTSIIREKKTNSANTNEKKSHFQISIYVSDSVEVRQMKRATEESEQKLIGK